MRRSLVVILLSAAAISTAPLPAGAQSLPPEPGPRVKARPSFEYFVARNRLSRGGAESQLDGVGGRVLWPLAGAPSPLLSRSALGGYLVHSPAEDGEPEMWHYGVQADVRLTRAPLAGRIEPLLSLGVGAVRVEEPLQTSLLAPVLRPLAGSVRSLDAFGPPAGRATRARTDPSLVPGVGARLKLFPGFGFRGDVRMLVDFRERTTRNLEVAGGISIGG